MASCDSSRGHIGLAAPGGGGGICAWTSVPSSTETTSVAHATTDLDWVANDFSGISRHQGNKGGHRPRRTAAGAAGVIGASFTCFSGQRHVVSAAIVRWFRHAAAFRRKFRSSPKTYWNPRLADTFSGAGLTRCSTNTTNVGWGNSGAKNRTATCLALAGDRDVFAADCMAAILASFRNGARDVVRIDAAVGGRLREVPRLAIGLGCVRAALFTACQALVDPVAVGGV